MIESGNDCQLKNRYVVKLEFSDQNAEQTPNETLLIWSEKSSTISAEDFHVHL